MKTKGADGDCIDVFIGPHPDSERVWIVDQDKVGTENANPEGCNQFTGPGCSGSNVSERVDALPNAPAKYGEGYARPPFPIKEDVDVGQWGESKITGKAFVYVGDKKHGVPEGEVRLDQLIATQSFVSRKQLKAIGEKSDDQLDRPCVLKVGNKLYLAEGHHRASLAKLRGDEKIKVWLWDQPVTNAAQFDESKVMLGFDSEEAALQAYRDSYPDDWQGFAGITELTVDQFKRWLKDGDTSRPVAGQTLNSNPEGHNQYTVLYHGTSSNQIESIKKHGLIPGAGKGMDSDQSKTHVFLTADEDVAKSYAEDVKDEHEGSYPVVLKIKVPHDAVIEDHNSSDYGKHPLERDPASRGDDAAWRFKGKIKPEWIIHNSSSQELYQPFVINGKVGWFPVGNCLPLVEVPDVRQDNHWTCGAACFASVVQHFSFDIGVDEAAEMLGTNVEKSTDPQSIWRELTRLGLRAVPRDGMTLDDLSAAQEAGEPVIVCVQDYMGRRSAKAEFDYGHYLCVLGRYSGYVFCMDPSLENWAGVRSRPVENSNPEGHNQYNGKTEHSAADVQEIVKQSPNVANRPELQAPSAFKRFANRFGYGEDDGPFVSGMASVKSLEANIKSGHLRMSGTTTKEGVADKVESGKLNAVIITHEPGRNMLVVDGNHSLLAAIKRGDDKVRVIVDRKHADVLDSTTNSSSQEAEQGGDVRDGQDANLDAPGRVMIREQDFLDAWHDVGEDGTKYVRFGIRVGRGSVLNEQQRDELGRFAAGMHHAGKVTGMTLKAAQGIIDKVPGAKWMRSKTKQLNDALVGRYGAKTALAIVASGQAFGWGLSIGGTALTGVPVYVPFSTIVGMVPGACLAELHHQLTKGKQAVENAAEAVDVDAEGCKLVERLMRLWEDRKQQEDFTENVYNSTTLPKSDWLTLPDEVEVPKRVFDLLTELDDSSVQNAHVDSLEAFQRWLRKQLGDLVRGKSQEELWDAYIHRGFERGAGRSFDDVRKPYAKWYSEADKAAGKGAREEFLRSSFGQPEAREKVQLLAARSFDELENVTEDMSNKISRALTDGLVQGKHPFEIARDMTDEVDISLSRARTVSRTELIRAHASGQLIALKQLGADEVGVEVEWRTSGLDSVDKKGNMLSPCERCNELQGLVLTLDQAEGLIPLHPNCTCAFIPAGVGEDDEGQIRKKQDKVAALEAAGLDPDEVLANLLFNANPNHDELGRFATSVSIEGREAPPDADPDYHKAAVEKIEKAAQYVLATVDHKFLKEAGVLKDGKLSIRISSHLDPEFQRRGLTGTEGGFADDDKVTLMVTGNKQDDVTHTLVHEIAHKWEKAHNIADGDEGYQWANIGDVSRLSQEDKDRWRYVASPGAEPLVEGIAQALHPHDRAFGSTSKRFNEHFPKSVEIARKHLADKGITVNSSQEALRNTHVDSNGRIVMSVELTDAELNALGYSRLTWNSLEDSARWRAKEGHPLSLEQLEMVVNDVEQLLVVADGLRAKVDNWCNQYGGTTCKADSAGAKANASKAKVVNPVKEPTAKMTKVPISPEKKTDKQLRGPAEKNGRKKVDNTVTVVVHTAFLDDDLFPTSEDEATWVHQWLSDGSDRWGRMDDSYSQEDVTENGGRFWDELAVLNFDEQLVERDERGRFAGHHLFSDRPGHGITADKVEQQQPSEKAQRAKAAHVLVDKDIQRYAEEHNEPRLAKVLGGVALPDSEPKDIETPKHLIEMKTMVSNTNGKITMDSYSQVRKIVDEEETGKTFHTIVSDDTAVYNANGVGQHGDDADRVYYYRRGVAGSARIQSMHRCKNEAELKKLMKADEADLPAAAQRTDDHLRVGKWQAIKGEDGRNGFRNSKTDKEFYAKK